MEFAGGRGNEVGEDGFGNGCGVGGGVVGGGDGAAGGENPVGDENLVEQGGAGALDDGADIGPAFFPGLVAHVFAGEVVAADDGDLVVEDGDFAVVAKVGGAAGGEGDDGEKFGDLAAGFAQGIDEAAAGEKAAEGVELEANLDALAGAAGEEFDDAFADLVATEDVGGDVDGVAGFEDAAFEFGEGEFAVGEEADGVAGDGIAGAAGANGLGDGVVAGGLGGLGVAGDGEADAAFAGDEAANFLSAEKKEKRHAYVGQEDDDEEPGEGVAGLAALAGDSREGEEHEEDAADGVGMGPEAGGDDVGDVVGGESDFSEGQHANCP